MGQICLFTRHCHLDGRGLCASLLVLICHKYLTGIANNVTKLPNNLTTIVADETKECKWFTCIDIYIYTRNSMEQVKLKRILLVCGFYTAIIIFIQSCVVMYHEPVISQLRKQTHSEVSTETIQWRCKRALGRKFLIHSVSSFKPYTFLIYSTLVHREKYLFRNCTIDGQEVMGRGRGVGIFECDIETKVHDDAVLSIKMANNKIIPSLAIWKEALPLEPIQGRKLQLCIVSMVKDEESRIADWVEYHSRQEVGLFVLYDNNSTDKTVSIAKQYTNVIIIDWPWHKTQVQVFLHGVLSLRKACSWVLLIDVDEYLFPKGNENTTVRDLITNNVMRIDKHRKGINYKPVSQICFISKNMGPSGHIKCPNMAVSEAYIHLQSYSSNGKCAVRPNKINPRTGIHRFSVKGRTVVINRNEASIVHYKWQCWEYYLTKFTKGRASSLVSDWKINKLNKNRPTSRWTKPLDAPDIEFRDYKRRIDKWPFIGVS